MVGGRESGDIYMMMFGALRCLNSKFFDLPYYFLAPIDECKCSEFEAVSGAKRNEAQSETRIPAFKTTLVQKFTKEESSLDR